MIMAKLESIEGIGSRYANTLRKSGVRSTGDLLKKGSTPTGRKQLADATGISDRLILEWVNHADLFRIKGVAEEYSDLLEEAGVDTVVELAQRNAENLYEKILQVNQAKKLVRQLPTAAQVANWIVQAKSLPRVISY
jgi:predicted flap endonuclease-1-like 5' DNA nuclease